MIYMMSLPADVHKGRQVTFPQHGGHTNGSHDVSPPLDADKGRQGTLYQQGDKDLHGDKERRKEDKEATQLCNTAHVHSATC